MKSAQALFAAGPMDGDGFSVFTKLYNPTSLRIESDSLLKFHSTSLDDC